MGAHTGAPRQRQGFPRHPDLLQAQPARTEPDRPVGLLHLARRDLPGLPEPAHLPVRSRAGRGRLGHVSAEAGLHLRGGDHRLEGRPLPPLRRRGRRHRLRRRGRRGRPEAGRRGDARRRPDPRHHPGLRGQQRRLGQGQLHGPERRRPGRRDHRGAGAGRDRAGDDRLYRNARHRHFAGRPDRDRGTDEGFRRDFRPGLLRSGRLEGKRRPSRGRRGRGGADQDDPRARARRNAAGHQFLQSQSADRLRRDPPFTSTGS